MIFDKMIDCPKKLRHCVLQFVILKLVLLRTSFPMQDARGNGIGYNKKYTIQHYKGIIDATQHKIESKSIYVQLLQFWRWNESSFLRITSSYCLQNIKP